jgi:hypothetical protein
VIQQRKELAGQAVDIKGDPETDAIDFNFLCPRSIELVVLCDRKLAFRTAQMSEAISEFII